MLYYKNIKMANTQRKMVDDDFNDFMKDMKKGKANLEDALILIDCSALIDMFNGDKKNKADELLKMMKTLNDNGKKLKIFTPTASFLRAVFLADPEKNIQNIQKTLTFLEVMPSFADFKNEKAVRDEIIKVAEISTKAVHGGERSNG